MDEGSDVIVGVGWKISEDVLVWGNRVNNYSEVGDYEFVEEFSLDGLFVSYRWGRENKGELYLRFIFCGFLMFGFVNLEAIRDIDKF